MNCFSSKPLKEISLIFPENFPMLERFETSTMCFAINNTDNYQNCNLLRLMTKSKTLDGILLS